MLLQIRNSLRDKGLEERANQICLILKLYSVQKIARFNLVGYFMPNWHIVFYNKKRLR